MFWPRLSTPTMTRERKTKMRKFRTGEGDIRITNMMLLDDRQSSHNNLLDFPSNNTALAWLWRLLTEMFPPKFIGEMSLEGYVSEERAWRLGYPITNQQFWDIESNGTYPSYNDPKMHIIDPVSCWQAERYGAGDTFPEVSKELVELINLYVKSQKNRNRKLLVNEEDSKVIVLTKKGDLVWQ